MTAITASRPDPESAASSQPIVAVITNAGSTQNKGGENWIDRHLADAPGVVHLPTSDPSQIPAALRHAAAAKADVIVVNGGDGTADLVFGSLLNDKPFATPPALALLSSGKTNMTAAAWSFGGDKAAALAWIMRARNDGTLLNHVTQRPILTVDRGDGSAPLRGAFLGAADVVDGILFCRKHIYPLNLPNAISHGISISILFWRSLFRGSQATPMITMWDNTEGENGRFFFVSATTLDKLVLDLAPYPQDGQGPLRYLSLKSGARSVLAAIPKVISKILTSGTGHMVRSAARVTLAFDGAYTLDGELYHATRAAPLTVSAHDSLPFIRMPGP